MDEKADLFETLIDRATDYGKTSFELVKLKALDKSTDIVSSIVPGTILILLVSTFFLFLNLGIALWLGEVLGKMFYGFFVVAGFYVLVSLIIHFFLNKWIKRVVGDYFIKRMLK
jgi:hypothetical protein